MREPPHPGWLAFFKLLFGFMLLLSITVLAGIIALGQVEQQTSYGLNIILGGLLTLSGGFVQWCFGDKKD